MTTVNVIVDSRDGDGHFCGQSVETGQLVDATEGGTKVGYCGPNCTHCVGHAHYMVDEGVWVCAADYDYEKAKED